MAASSVTGVGPGSADTSNKGSAHMHLGVEKLIGPRVVDGGVVALTSGTPSTANVPFTKTLTSATGYFVITTPVGGTSGSTIDTAVSTVATTGFTITGPNSSSGSVNWVLVYNPDSNSAGVIGFSS